MSQKDTLNKAESNVKSSVATLATPVTDAVESLRDKAGEVIGTSRQWADYATKSVTDVYENAEGSVTDTVKAAKKLVKKYPLETLFAGIAGGLLVGLLLGRRK